MAIKKCPVCKKTYDNIDSLCNHMDSKHNDIIPQGWSSGKYYFYSNHDRTSGKCIVCGKDTNFNEVTKKPNRLCDNNMCRVKLRDTAKQNMMNKYGKETLLNDPEFQKNMLNNRSISKDYKWSDDISTKRVVGSYEYDMVQFLDIFMNYPSDDVIIPAPFIIDYEYEGKTHFYIPDIYLTSVNLIIEVKDGYAGTSSENTHPKIQAVDKVKEKAKEDAIRKLGKYNYVKVANKQYEVFLKALLQLKNQEDIKSIKFTPIIITNEMANDLGVSDIDDPDYSAIMKDLDIIGKEMQDKVDKQQDMPDILNENVTPINIDSIPQIIDMLSKETIITENGLLIKKLIENSQTEEDIKVCQFEISRISEEEDIRILENMQYFKLYGIINPL